MDRNELIKALGAAFSEEKDENKNRVQVESAVAGEKSVLRVTEIRDNNPRFELMHSHPEAYVVDNLISELLNCGDRDAERSGRSLQQKFEAMVQAKQTDRIHAVIRESRELLAKLQSARAQGQTPQRALVYMLIADRVAQM